MVALDWGYNVPKRKHPLAKCEECPLAWIGAYTPTKFPTKDSPIKIAVVGEAPGFQEAQRGEPFVGASGKLLNKVLDYHKIDREELLLTNACLCRPPDNATPPKAAIQACSERLKSDLSGVDRVLALGATSSQHLLQTRQGITSLRVGPRRPSPLVGAEVVPTVHPAYCLRNGDAFPDLVTDVGKLQKNHTPWVPPQYVVADTEQDALVLLMQLADPKFEELVVDIECGIEKDVSFGHPNTYDMLCVGLGYAKGKALIIGENALKFPTVIDALRVLLGLKRIVEQNGKFDNSGLYPLLGDIKLYFDTMLAHYCLDERRGGHGLKELAAELLGAPDYEKDIQKYLVGANNYSDIPRPFLYKYNAYDVALTWELKEYFEPLLEAAGKRKLHDFLVAASNELKFVELNGITVDKEYSRKLSEEYLTVLAEMEDQLDKLIERGYDKRGGINPRSPKQVKEYLLDEGIKVASTDADTLQAILPKLDPLSSVGQFVALLLQHRLKAKRHGTFIKGIRSRTYRGRVYTTYLLHGTTSGRLASRNPNLQNIVRDPKIRQQFCVAKEGKVFIQNDYKQAEGRVICTEAQDEYLRRLFSDPNIDIFADLGMQLYSKAELTKDERVRVKAFFYGIGYGREAYSLAMEYGWSPRQAEKELADFKDLIPDVVRWQEGIQKTILDGKDLTTPFGRSRRFMLITRENRKDVLKEGLSFKPQSISSDICLSAFIRLRPMLRGMAFIRLLIHDALVAEAKEEHAKEVARIMTEVMIEEGRKYTDYVPFAVDTSYGKHWGEL